MIRPVTPKVEPIVPVPVIPKLPPANKFSATPAPPSTIRAPEVALVEPVVALMLVLLVTSNVPAITAVSYTHLRAHET